MVQGVLVKVAQLAAFIVHDVPRRDAIITLGRDIIADVSLRIAFKLLEKKIIRDAGPRKDRDTLGDGSSMMYLDEGRGLQNPVITHGMQDGSSTDYMVSR